MNYQFLAVLMFLGIAVANAAPPPGADPSSPEHAWWECQTNKNLTGWVSHSCCSESDGHQVQDKDWRANPDGHGGIQVRIRGQWWGVPPQTLQVQSTCGAEPNVATRYLAKVWYSSEWDAAGNFTPRIYCFKEGVME